MVQLRLCSQLPTLPVKLHLRVAVNVRPRSRRHLFQLRPAKPYRAGSLFARPFLEEELDLSRTTLPLQFLKPRQVRKSCSSAESEGITLAMGTPCRASRIRGVGQPLQSSTLLGNTRSEFTSWTSDPSVASWPEFAGEDGVLARVFRLSELIQSSTVTDYPDRLSPEFEYLVRGPVTDAVVVKK